MENLMRQQSAEFTAGTRRPVTMEKTYAYSVSGGAGGHGTKISTASFGTRLGSSFRHRYDSGMTLAIGNEKTTMQNLNDRLATYLEMVRKLEKANAQLEIKIREYVENKGPMDGRDYSKYFATIEDLRANIFSKIQANAQLAISIDNARLASDDFRVKMEYEMYMRKTVEADVARLKKILDDTNITRLHVESDIESLREELITLKKNHEKDLAELRTKIIQSGVHVDVDAPKGQDLARVMEEMREKYEKIALKNKEELKAWHECQITEVESQVTESTIALKEATTQLSDAKRRYQGLDIELQSALSLKASLEANLCDTEMRYNNEVEKLNVVILRLQEELSQICADIKQNTREYEHLLNVKVKLEAEISEYRRLLDHGSSLKLEDAVDTKLVETKMVTITQTLVDGKVVSESKDVKSSEKHII